MLDIGEFFLLFFAIDSNKHFYILLKWIEIFLLDIQSIYVTSN